MMEHRCIKKKSLNFFSNDVGHKVTLEYFQSKSSNLLSSPCPCPQCHLSSSIRKYYQLVPGHYFSNCRISNPITRFDEQYLSHCLELIQISAAKAASFNLSVTWTPSKSSQSFPSPRNLSIGAILPDGSGTGSESRSPLFQHCSANNDIGSETLSLASIQGSLDSYHYGSPGGFSMCSSSPVVEMGSRYRKHGSDRSQYMSSIVSTSSDLSSCAWPAISHGTLQCTWRNGIPHFVFSVDNKRQVYVTRPSKAAASDGSDPDWTYFIHVSSGNQKEHDFRSSHESGLVGRMNVSARCRLNSDGSKVRETEFVLYGDNEYQERQLENSSHRRFPGKVSKFLKPLHLPKHRSSKSSWGTSSSLDLCSVKPEQDEDWNAVRPNLSENYISSNFELAAIVVKEQETDVGGWGLSFLKRAEEKQATDCQPGREFSSQDRPVTVETSMDIIVPAGYHGGPKTRSTGPSSLAERWRCGGQCDCGGWDTGCPLTLLNTRSDDKGSDPDSFDLFVKGGEGRAAWMKMVNIQNGLHCIDFQSRLSALQCFSIAVAAIHNRSPALRPGAQTSYDQHSTPRPETRAPHRSFWPV